VFAQGADLSGSIGGVRGPHAHLVNAAKELEEGSDASRWRRQFPKRQWRGERLPHKMAENDRPIMHQA
jgi:hypothetical protein